MVRLELPPPASAPDSREAPSRSYESSAAVTPKQTRAAPRPAGIEQPQPAGGAASIPLQRETRVYAALELDTLPGPTGPIDIAWLQQGAPAYRMELTIDERGFVERIAVLDSLSAGPIERRLRAALEQTRFFPARKDGRPVRSRVILQITSTARQPLAD